MVIGLGADLKMSGLYDSLKKWMGLRKQTAKHSAFVSPPRLEVRSYKFPLPHGTSWTWRPEVWCTTLAKPELVSAQYGAKLGSELKLFHDCPQAEVILRQELIPMKAESEAYELILDVSKFYGSFLSLVLDLPQAALAGLQERHIIRVAMKAETGSPLEVFTRLNIKHGPNTERLVRKVVLSDEEVIAEFDLADSELNEQRLEGAWVDLIFNEPQDRKVTIQDLTLCRYPRAEI